MGVNQKTPLRTVQIRARQAHEALYPGFVFASASGRVVASMRKAFAVCLQPVVCFGAWSRTQTVRGLTIPRNPHAASLGLMLRIPGSPGSLAVAALRTERCRSRTLDLYDRRGLSPTLMESYHTLATKVKSNARGIMNGPMKKALKAAMREIGKRGGTAAAARMTPEARTARATKASLAAAEARRRRAAERKEEA